MNEITTITRAAVRDRYTVVHNTTIEDDRLSFRALGLLVYILSKPDNWHTHVSHLCTTHKEGREAVRMAVVELEDAGYVTRAWKREPGQETPTMHYLVSEVTSNPACPETRQAESGCPETGLPRNRDSRNLGTQESVATKEGLSVKTELRVKPDRTINVRSVPSPPPLCSLLAELMVGNGCKAPSINNTWIDAERRLLNIDHRDADEAEKVLRWCQQDQFWRGNILSLPKFRAQYDKLRLAMQRNNTPSWQKEDATNRNVDRIVGDERRNGSYSVQKAKPVARPVFQFAVAKNR